MYASRISQFVNIIITNFLRNKTRRWSLLYDRWFLRSQRKSHRHSAIRLTWTLPTKPSLGTIHDQGIFVNFFHLFNRQVFVILILFTTGFTFSVHVPRHAILVTKLFVVRNLLHFVCALVIPKTIHQVWHLLAKAPLPMRRQSMLLLLIGLLSTSLFLVFVFPAGAGAGIGAGDRDFKLMSVGMSLKPGSREVILSLSWKSFHFLTNFGGGMMVSGFLY